MVTRIYYNRTNACDKCGRKLFPGKPAYPRREYDEKGNWTGR